MSKILLNSLIVCPDIDRNYPSITRGSGVYLYDDLGKEYIDASGCSAAVSNIGHGNEALAEVIYNQARKISLFPTHEFCSPVVEEYFSELIRFCPKGFSKVWTATSGTEAVEQSVKFAIQYHQLKGNSKKHKVLSRWGSYHGNSVFMLDIGGMPLRRDVFKSLMQDFVHVSPANFYRSNYKDEASYSRSLVEELEQVILSEDPDTVAAFVFEPVVGAALGAVPPPDNYLEQVREVCTKYEILLIADEVMTGFGRTGKNFGVDHWNLIPDIIACGKGISSGYYPLSAVIVQESIASIFEKSKVPFLGGHTYSCNPVGAAVGKFVLDFIHHQGLVKNADTMGKIFIEKLNRLYQYDIVGDIRGKGLLLGIELVANKDSREAFSTHFNISKRVGDQAIKNGVVVYPGKGSVDGRVGDHILLAPPLIINEEQLEVVVNVLAKSIESVTEELVRIA